MVFSATWFLLEQEGLLAQACLCNGLTALQRANLGDKKGVLFGILRVVDWFRAGIGTFIVKASPCRSVAILPAARNLLDFLIPRQVNHRCKGL